MCTLHPVRSFGDFSSIIHTSNQDDCLTNHYTTKRTTLHTSSRLYHLSLRDSMPATKRRGITQTINCLLLGAVVLISGFAPLTAQTGYTDTILLSTDLKQGETIYLIIGAEEIKVEGATGEFANMSISEYVIDRTDVPLKIEGKNITIFDCSNNLVTALDVSAAPSLVNLVCNTNKVHQLRIPQGDKLKVLGCANNKLSSLDLSGAQGLISLSCSNNDLTELSLKKNTALESVSLGRNKISQIDVRDNVALRELFCPSNEISSLDLSKNTALQLIDCDSNKLTQLDLSAQLAIETIRCQANEIKNLDLTKNKKLTSLYCAGNQLSELNLTDHEELLFLNCALNKLSRLDLNKSTKLLELICYENKITDIEQLDECTQLSELWCYGNKLTKLDVNGLNNLTKLMCFANELTHLDVSQCLHLQELACFRNNLEELSLYDNNLLVTLSCFSNNIKGDKMTNLVNGLPDSPEFFHAKLFVISSKDPTEQNVCLKSDVSIAKEKKWIVEDYDLDNDSYVDYEGSEMALYTPQSSQCNV